MDRREFLTCTGQATALAVGASFGLSASAMPSETQDGLNSGRIRAFLPQSADDFSRIVLLFYGGTRSAR